MPDPKKQSAPIPPTLSEPEIVPDPNSVAEKFKYYGPNVPVPNQMQALDPKLIASLPPFMRNIGARMGVSPEKLPYLAHVDNPIFGSKKDIKVDEPKFFTRPVAAHEGTHVFQNTRIESARPSSSWDKSDKAYDYGGAEGLLKARAEKKTIADFTDEKQAQIVEDYYAFHLAVLQVAQWQNGHLWPSQAEWFEKKKAAYQPFVNQLVGLPDESTPGPEKLTQTLNTKPPTPGLPPSSVTNELQLDPNIAGALAPIPVWRLK